jgi:hypothetical protein
MPRSLAGNTGLPPGAACADYDVTRSGLDLLVKYYTKALDGLAQTDLSAININNSNYNVSHMQAANARHAMPGPQTQHAIPAAGESCIKAQPYRARTAAAPVKLVCVTVLTDPLESGPNRRVWWPHHLLQ